MKKILITGAKSYVGTNVEKFLMRETNKYTINTLDMKNSSWKNYNFNDYDVVFHVAGIAHSNLSKRHKGLYFKVNSELTNEVALKAKNEGVKHFILMSSMIVYNTKEKKITKSTVPRPNNFYGQSKLEAETLLMNHENDSFKISIIRAPMIYGVNSKGNFIKLIAFSFKTKIFPKYYNKRSVLHIDNLSNVIKNIIDKNIYGVLFPQDQEYMCVYKIVKTVSSFVEKKVYFTRIFNPFIIFLINKISMINKVFSDFYYDLALSENLSKFCQITFEDSLKDIVNSIQIANNSTKKDIKNV